MRSKQDIIEDLRNKGFNVIDAINILKREKRTLENRKIEIVKRGLSLFMITFDNKKKNRKDLCYQEYTKNCHINKTATQDYTADTTMQEMSRI